MFGGDFGHAEQCNFLFINQTRTTCEHFTSLYLMRRRATLYRLKEGALHFCVALHLINATFSILSR